MVTLAKLQERLAVLQSDVAQQNQAIQQVAMQIEQLQNSRSQMTANRNAMLGAIEVLGKILSEDNSPEATGSEGSNPSPVAPAESETKEG